MPERSAHGLARGANELQASNGEVPEYIDIVGGLVRCARVQADLSARSIPPRFSARAMKQSERPHIATEYPQLREAWSGVAQNSRLDTSTLRAPSGRSSDLVLRVFIQHYSYY
jgi:hypothetical protein